MASEVQRVAKRYFIQTPNRYFPIEPHFLFPLFQFLPISIRVWLVMNLNVGWGNKWSNEKDAEEFITSIKLFSKRDFLIYSLLLNALKKNFWINKVFRSL